MRDTTRLQVVRQGGAADLDVLGEELKARLEEMRLLTFHEVAAVIRRSEATVRRRVNDGHLPSVLEGGQQRVRMSDLRAYIESLPDGGGSH